MVKQLHHPAVEAYFLPVGTIAASAQHVLKQWLMARPLDSTQFGEAAARKIAPRFLYERRHSP